VSAAQLGRRWPWIGLLCFFAAAWFALGAVSASELSLLVLAFYYGLAGSSFSFLYGTVGIFSLAQPVFLAVGGYTGVYLYTQYGISPWLSILISMALAALLALPMGFLALFRGGTIMTALVTLIVAEAVPPILAAIKPLGGSVGLYLNLQPGSNLAAMQFSGALPFARLFLLGNVAVIGFFMLFKRSRFGLWAAASRDSPAAAGACGVPVLRIRLAIFVGSSMIAALAGLVYAQYNLLVNADLFLGATTLFQVVVVALVGGAARPWGALVGAILVTELSYYLTQAASGRPGISPLTFAGVFLVIAILAPRGLSGTWERWATARIRRGPRRPAAAATVPGPPSAGAPDRAAQAEPTADVEREHRR